MVTIRPTAFPLTHEEKERLTSLLGAVSSHTLLKVLRDMEGHNADARLILEVLIERATPDPAGHQAPVIPR